MAAEKVALQNQIASLHDALRKAREEADAEKAAKLSAIQQHGGISSELKDLRARLEQMRQACQAEREKAEAELERQRQIAAIQRDQERTQMRSVRRGACSMPSESCPIPTIPKLPAHGRKPATGLVAWPIFADIVCLLGRSMDVADTPCGRHLAGSLRQPLNALLTRCTASPSRFPAKTPKYQRGMPRLAS